MQNDSLEDQKEQRRGVGAAFVQQVRALQAKGRYYSKEKLDVGVDKMLIAAMGGGAESVGTEPM